MHKYTATVYLSSEEIERINRLLSIDCFENMTEEEMQKAGAKFDEHEGIFGVEFDDGSCLTYDLCSGHSNYFDDVIWRSANCKREVTLGCSYELADIEFIVDDTTYFVKVCSEPEEPDYNHLLWDILQKHRGHHIYAASYGDWNDPVNVTLECEDCGCIVLDAGLYTICAREDV